MAELTLTQEIKKNKLITEIEEQVSSIVTISCGLGIKADILYKKNMYKEIAQNIVCETLNKIASTGAKVINFGCQINSKDIKESGINRIINEISYELEKLGINFCDISTEETGLNIDKFDITGFATGINPVKKEEIKSGDIIIGFSSKGVHTNGFSKLINLYNEGRLSQEDIENNLQAGNNYYPEIYDLYQKNKIKDCIYINNGGIEKNLKTILSGELKANLNLKHIPSQDIFDKLKEIYKEDFYNLFNAGTGYCIIAERASNELFFEDCQKYNPIVLGTIEEI